mmetsp:Transcript_36239/g.69498  ORF Transcript_36239/g.69498 Transcript_36239/m.69498 type:complete len:386 (-) Transcript_36239:739-1896(-)
MKAEHLRGGQDGEVADVREVGLVVALRRHVPDPGGREAVVVVHDGGHEGSSHGVAQDGHQGAPVLGVRHAPAVVALAHQVHQRLERDGQVGRGELVQEHLQLPQRNLEVRVRELVGDVPPEGAKLDALLHQGVEEGQSKQQLLPLRRPLAPVEKLRVAHRVVEVALKDVGAHAHGRLVGHLDPVLQHRHREVRGRVRREPQPGHGVCVVGVDAFAYSLERRHPAYRQVAVLQHHPAAHLHRVLDVLLGLGTLALPQRDAADARRHLLLLRKLQERRGGVRPGRQHEDEGRGWGGVRVARPQVEERRLHKLDPQLLRHKVLHRRHQLVRADAAHHAQLLERVELVEGSRQRLLVRLQRVVQRPPRARVLEERTREALERRQRGEAA